jgi:putative phosphoribosyl transferase
MLACWRSMHVTLFRDRHHAGQALALSLAAQAGGGNTLVLALPRGGVPVAYEVARALGAPLDVIVVRKLGVPGHEEYAMGAVASGGIRVLNDEVVRGMHIGAASIDATTARELAELQRRERAYRGGAAAPSIAGRELIVVDDGLATGATMRAAVRALRTRRPARIVVAAPVCSRSACTVLETQADAVMCIHVPDDFRAVGNWYQDFEQTSDEEVCRLLRASGGSG